MRPETTVFGRLIGIGGGLLEVGMMVAVGRFHLFYRHAERAGGIPDRHAALHQPGGACVAQDVRRDLLAELGLDAGGIEGFAHRPIGSPPLAWITGPLPPSLRFHRLRCAVRRRGSRIGGRRFVVSRTRSPRRQSTPASRSGQPPAGPRFQLRSRMAAWRVPVEAIAQRVDAEKQRQVGYRVIEVANRAVDEIAELRREIGDLAKEVARRK